MDELKPETALSHYRIVSKIGAGGMGEVYLAEDTRLGRKVAIKFLSEQFSRDADKLDRFVQEAKAASALNHPNILTVYDIGESDGKNYIATEYIEGKTLRERIRPRSPMQLDEILAITLQVAEALAAAHRAGIVHRDIKPENIMVRGDGYAKLLDFGLAKLTENHPTLGQSGGHAVVKTTPGMIMGTIAYMSPEQASGKSVDHRSDIFSLGSVLYEMLTCRQPFTGETNAHTLIAILEHQPLPLATNKVYLPAEIENITLRMLQKSEDDRYQSLDEVVKDLTDLKNRIAVEEHIERSNAPSPDAVTQVLMPDTIREITASNTIAVLPFANLSSGEDSDYFSDGLAEELLNVLSKIQGLRVAARTSAFSFKGKQTTVAEIGRTLNVASVLEGSVRTSGNRVRISTRLTKVADGYNLWSQTYDREMNDIFAVQDDIAQTVVEEVRAMLVGEDFDATPSSRVVSEVARAVRGRADDPEAQRLMLLGRYLLDRTTREDTERAVESFKQAVEIDPGYALGWAELGRAYSVQAGKVWTPVEAGYANARSAIEKALVIEPNLAEAHAQLGRIQSAYDMDMSGARASYRQALELAPGNPIVIDGASILEFKYGNLDEALKMSRQVISQDPLSAAIWHNLGLICHAADLLPEAEHAFERALELGQQRFVTAAMLSLVQLDLGKGDEALATAAKEPDEFWSTWAKSMILHHTEQRDEAYASFEKLIELSAEGDAYQIAEVEAVRGNFDAAFDWLERSLTEHDPGVTHAKTSPRLRGLYDDARWPLFLTKIGLSD